MKIRFLYKIIYEMVKCKKCDRQACFGKKGSKQAIYCKEHKEDEHVNVKDKKCEHPNCTKIPNYGKKGSKNAIYCVEHKEDEHVDLKNKKCKYPGCTKQACFGKKGSKEAIHCEEHKEDEHVNVKDKKCKHLNCTTRPTYGEKDTKNAIYCFDHKKPEHVDVINKKCKYSDCTKQPHYGYSGYPSEYCASHKNTRMILHPFSKPKEEEKNCIFCLAVIHYNEEYCSGCKAYISNGNVTVKRKEKELRVKTLLEENKIPFIHDRIVKNGISSKRPDFLIKTKNGFIILEVDEDQHNKKTYSCECEIVRMKQIYHDCLDKNILFIRYNPDRYKALKGEEITQKQREEYLIKVIKKYLTDPIKIDLGVIYLFYDGFINQYEIEEIEL